MRPRLQENAVEVGRGATLFGSILVFLLLSGSLGFSQVSSSGRSNSKTSSGSPAVPNSSGPQKVTSQSVNVYPQNKQTWTGCSWNLGGVLGNSDDQISTGTSWTTAKYRGYAVFDISSIPQNAILKSIVLHVYVNSASGDTLGVESYQIGHDPRSSASEAYNYLNGFLLTGGGPAFVPQSTGWYSLDISGYGYGLGGGISELGIRLADGYSWWAIGWDDNSVHQNGLEDFDGYSKSTRPYCTVTYDVPYIDLGSQIPTLGALAGSKVQFSISSNTSWQISGYAPWLSVSPTSGTGNAVVTLTANTTNTSASERNTNITISGNGASIAGPVTQAGAILTVSPTVVALGYNSGSNTNLNVESDINWSISGIPSWLSVVPSNGTKNVVVRITAQSTNPSTSSNRSANLTVTAGAITKQVSVSQDPTPAQFDVTPKVLSLGSAQGSSGQFTVEANTNWNITSFPSWLSVSPQSGSGNATVTLETTSTNTATSSRKGTVEVTGGNVTVSVSVSQDSTLALPGTPTANQASNVDTAQFTANWNAVAGADSYSLDVATDNVFTNFVPGYQALNVGNVTTYDVNGLSSGSTYYYRVRAHNEGGNGGYSNTVSIETVPSPPKAEPPDSDNVKPTSFTAKWHSVRGAAGYQIDVSTNINFTGYLSGYENKDVGDVDSCIVTGLTENATYFFRVRAYDNEGATSSNSDVVTFTLTSIEKIASGIPATFSLSQNYPNPFNPTTEIGFGLPKRAFVRLTVFDVLGREVTVLVDNELSAGSYRVGFDAARLVSGVYFYRLVAGNHVITRKMLFVK